MDRETFADACLQALNDELEGFAPFRYTVNPHARFLGSMLGTFTVDDIRQMVALPVPPGSIHSRIQDATSNTAGWQDRFHGR